MRWAACFSASHSICVLSWIRCVASNLSCPPNCCDLDCVPKCALGCSLDCALGCWAMTLDLPLLILGEWFRGGTRTNPLWPCLPQWMFVPLFETKIMSPSPLLRHSLFSHYCDPRMMLTQNILGYLVPVQGLWVPPLQFATEPTIHLGDLLTSLVLYPESRQIGQAAVHFSRDDGGSSRPRWPPCGGHWHVEKGIWVTEVKNRVGK